MLVANKKTYINKLANLFILFWVGFNQLFWYLKPNLINYTDMSKHARANLVIHSWTYIGLDLLIILIGYIIPKYRSKLERIIEIWFNILILGIILSLILALSTKVITIQLIYDSVFPILRNTYPIIAGIMLAIFISNNKLSNLNIFIILLLFAIPSIFSPDMFGWQSNTNPLLYTLLFLLGKGLNDIHVNTKKLWLSTITLFVFTTAVQAIRPDFNFSNDIDKYTNAGNILIVLTAFLIAKLFIKYFEPHFLANNFVISFLILIQNTSLLTYLDLIKKNTLSIHVAFFSTIVIFILFIAAWVWTKCFTVQVKITNETFKIKSLKQVIKNHWQGLLSFSLAYAISLVSVLAINDHDLSSIAAVIGKQQSMILLTALIIFAGIEFFNAIFRRYWISLIIITIFNAIYTIASKIKIKSRQEPILPSDIAEISNIKNLLSFTQTKIIILIAVFLIICIVLTAYLQIKHPVKIKYNSLKTIFYILLLPILLSSSYFWNTQDSAMNHLMNALNDQPTFFSQLDGAKKNGITIQFLNNVHTEIMAKPSGYSEAEIKKIVNKYQLQANQINTTRTNKLKDQTIIFNLSESFADPARVPNIKMKQDPIPHIHQIKKHTTSGLMMSSGYGGGTANMEWMTLTGYSLSSLSPTLSIPYTQIVPRQEHTYTFNNNFDYSVGIHPFIGTFYSRIPNYKKFKFNKFLYTGSKDPIKHQSKIDRSQYLSDKTAYDNALDQLHNHKSGQFINLITMQNHMPFDQHYYNNLSQYAATQLSSGTNANSLNDYITGIHYTDNSVNNFIQQIDKINKPITIVFYGDHLPGIYGNDMNIDNVVLHETDYFIYSNKYAREHGYAKKLTKNTKFVDPNDFIAMVAEQTNSKVNWYQALLTKLHQQLPAVSLNPLTTTAKGRNEFINQQGQMVDYKNFNQQQKTIWHDYQLIQYDMVAGHNYAYKYLNHK